ATVSNTILTAGKRGSPKGVAVVFRPRLLHTGDDRRLRGAQRGGVRRGADRHADAGVCTADIDRRLGHDRATAMTSIHHVGRHWRQVAWPQFAIMAFYSAIGIGLGFYFITMLDERTMRRSLGVFLILYALYAMVTAGAPPLLPNRWRRALAACTGISGG